jgi:hypothetical protein
VSDDSTAQEMEDANTQKPSLFINPTLFAYRTDTGVGIRSHPLKATLR